MTAVAHRAHKEDQQQQQQQLLQQQQQQHSKHELSLLFSQPASPIETVGSFQFFKFLEFYFHFKTKIHYEVPVFGFSDAVSNPIVFLKT